MRRLVVDLLKSLGLYLLLVVGGVFCFLSLSPVFGYLAYSDRPGPGWHRTPPVTWRVFWGIVVFLFGWLTLLLPYAIVAGLILYTLTRLLERVRVPRPAVAVVAAVLAALVSGYLVNAIGWYIAIAESPVYFAMVFGALFGGLLLPRRRRL